MTDPTYDRDIDVLIHAFKRALLDILDELTRLELTDMSRANSRAALAEVAKTLASLNAESAEWVKTYIPKAATDGVIQTILGLGVVDTVEEAAKIAKFSRLNREFVATAIADTQADLLAVTQNIDRKVRIAVRQATAESMRANLAKGINGRRTISRDILTNMRKSLGDAVNTGIVDAAGRRWKPETYVEMVTRTKMAQTHRETTVNEALGRGAMYARVSTHGAKDACANYEGMIVKLTPDAPGSYRYIGDLPRREIFHPRCRHVITPLRDPANAI